MKQILLHTLLFCFITCINAQESQKNFTLLNNNITINYASNNASIDIKTVNIQKGLAIASITLKSNQQFTPKKLSIKWSTPSNNIAGYWSSKAFFNKTITPDWGPAKVKSMLARHAPVISLFGFDDINQQTFAVSDALNTAITSTSVKEENGMIYNEVQLFTEKHKALKEYTVQLRLDTRPINYATSLNEVNIWWETFPIYKPAQVPEAAKLPVYSTWYSYHQNVTEEAILKECKQSKAMGYETVIVDDGWQTLDSNRGYAYTGDWQAERLKDIKSLVEKVHQLDMKFMLWYAVPFVGEKSSVYNQMKGKFLTHWKGQGTYVVDPRYPEVRKFIINTYIKAVKEWNLDGFKLDFIGWFKAFKDTKLVAKEGMDFASVNEATDKLMTDLMASLKQLKSDILIEFRQPYTGPLMKKYGNMLRASDCPNMAVTNRIETTDLRLISGKTAVHSDMIMWHYDEPVEVAALQFLNVLFSVPQISVRLADIPKEQFQMIRYYTKYWLENRSILLEGEFLPQKPQQNYPLIEAKGKNKKITVTYNTKTISLETDHHLKQDIINAKSSKRIILDVKGTKQKYNCYIHNCMGKLISNQKITLKEGVYGFDIPASGSISFHPINN
ncbi:glycoside hydrolase family 36 protein [Tenacibaculum sp. 190524A02b]|uniref:glycoside hydrolase family 36 protein n=1 Tax=Tenacibaculum vairaonense TaxID=3137860 RepID=UPI0031FB2D13